MTRPKGKLCKRCGKRYCERKDVHERLCHGNVPEGSNCVVCGEGDEQWLYECPLCDEIVCEVCRDDGSHDCF